MWLWPMFGQVVLPVAADDSVKVMENVYAWGHGPADGEVDIRSDGTVIFTDPAVEPTMYAKARVMFPVEWLTNLSEEARLANQGTCSTTGRATVTRKRGSIRIRLRRLFVLGWLWGCWACLRRCCWRRSSFGGAGAEAAAGVSRRLLDEPACRRHGARPCSVVYGAGTTRAPTT